MFYIGIDIGGTFTDMVLMDEKGEIHTYKTESTPKNLTLGVIESLRLASEDLGLTLEGLLKNTAYLGHGTTAATNTFIQQRGVKTGLITTKGFSSTMLLQRTMGHWAGLSEEQLTDYTQRAYPNPIVPPAYIKEVTERVDYKGKELVPLNKEEARKAVKELISEGIQAIAVSFLWSFMDPKHEQEMKEIIEQEASKVFITISSELVPVIREYERTSATVINCYLGPIMDRYIRDLGKSLKENGLRGSFLIMNSIGGVLSPDEASRQAIALLSSGPTGGVIASMYLGEALGYKDMITTDMGGTSFDVGLIVDGKPVITSTSIIGKYHIALPMINVISIGAGGGSIGWVENGYLRVGPQSAGSDPGPICYDKEGTEPTATDADVVLGLIDPDYFLGGCIRLNKKKAEEAIKERIAVPLGLDLIQAAAGIKTVSDSHMADLLRTATIEKGYDPRDFVLFAYGGAGPAHCSSYGAELNVKAIIVPSMAATFSAFGAAFSDLHYSYEISDLMRTPSYFDLASKYLDVQRINRNFQALEEKGTSILRRDGIREEDMILHRSLEMRYRRQTHEILIPVPGGELRPEQVNDLVVAFERRYEELYGKGSAFREAGVEITTFRLNAVGKRPKPKLKTYPFQSKDCTHALKGTRMAYFTEVKDFLETRVYDGLKMGLGNELKGPAIIEYPTTTIVISPFQTAFMDAYLNTVIQKKSQ